MQKLRNYAEQKRGKLSILTAIWAPTIIACTCTIRCFQIDEVDRSGLVFNPEDSFDVEPRTLVCRSEPEQVTVEWEVDQPEGCKWEPSSVTGCNFIAKWLDHNAAAAPHTTTNANTATNCAPNPNHHPAEWREWTIIGRVRQRTR